MSDDAKDGNGSGGGGGGVLFEWVMDENAATEADSSTQKELESVSLFQLARQAKLQNATAVKRVDARATADVATRERNALRAKLAAGYGLTPDPEPTHVPPPVDPLADPTSISTNPVPGAAGASPTSAAGTLPTEPVRSRISRDCCGRAWL